MYPQGAHKICTKCNLQKGNDAFSRNKARSDGLCSYCKPCNAAASAKLRSTRAPVTVPTVMHKVCRQCVRDLPSARYHRSTSYKDGLTGKCKECCAATISQRVTRTEIESVRRSCVDSTFTRHLGEVPKDAFIEKKMDYVSLISTSRAFTSLKPSMALPSLSLSEEGTGPVVHHGNQVLDDSSPLAEWDGRTATRQRVEHGLSTRRDSFTPTYGQEAMGPMAGSHQQEQQQQQQQQFLAAPCVSLDAGLELRLKASSASFERGGFLPVHSTVHGQETSRKRQLRSFTSLKPSMALPSLSLSEEGTGLLVHHGNQVLDDSSPLAECGGRTATRQRVEHGLSTRRHSFTPTYGQEVMGPMAGTHQQQQLQQQQRQSHARCVSLDAGLELRLKASSASFERGGFLPVHSIVHGQESRRKRQLGSGCAPPEATVAGFTAPHALASRLYCCKPPSGMAVPSALIPLRSFSMGLLERYFPADCQIDEDDSCFDSRVSGFLRRLAALPQSELGFPQSNDAVGAEASPVEPLARSWYPHLAASELSVPRFHSGGGGLGKPDITSGRAAQAIPGYGPGSRIVEGWEQARESPTGTYLSHPFMAVCNSQLGIRQAASSGEQRQQRPAPLALPVPVAPKQGPAEHLHAFDLRQIRKEEAAMQRMMGWNMTPWVLSAAAAAAFPSLTRRFG